LGDVFKEQIVKRKPTAKDMAIRVCLIVLVVLIFLVATALIGPQFSIIILAAAGFGAAYLMSFLSVEYEYVFTNGELDIDAIYNRSRRKRVFSANVNDIEIMAHVDDKVRAGDMQSYQDLRDYSSGTTTPDTYAFMINYKTKRTKIIMEPNEKMLKAMSGVLTRRKLHVQQ